MKVLLTGAAGFLGRNLLLQAPADWEIVALYRGGEAFPGFVRGLANPRIAAVPCDLSDPAAVSRLCETHGAEWESCVYLAAKVDIPWSVREPNQDLLANVSPLLNLLERVRVATQSGRFSGLQSFTLTAVPGVGRIEQRRCACDAGPEGGRGSSRSRGARSWTSTSAAASRRTSRT